MDGGGEGRGAVTRGGSAAGKTSHLQEVKGNSRVVIWEKRDQTQESGRGPGQLDLEEDLSGGAETGKGRQETLARVPLGWRISSFL